MGGRLVPTWKKVFASGAVIPWYLSGGIAAANCIAAYQPKGAASLAASYVNLANPGTYNAAPGVAPTFNAATGWTFNGTTQYLTTGITPGAQVWSAFCQFNGQTGTGYQALFGLSQTPGDKRFWIIPMYDSNRAAFGSGGYIIGGVGTNKTTGNLGIAGTQGYFNGSSFLGAITAGVDSTITIFIGCINSNGSATFFISATIIALAIYNVTITPAQITALSTAMAAL